MTYFANESAQVGLDNIAGPPDLVYSGDVVISDVRLTKTYDTNVRADGTRVATTSIVSVWTPACPFSSASYTFVSGAGSILAQSVSCRCSGAAPMRLNDSGTCQGVWNQTSAPYTPIACSCNFSVTDAGQDKARGL